ncbi:pentapeptide repeat-containing protein [Streptomyces sp. BH106]|uniref:pentapeptide repeat-containing protein n=1 Tax=Streptomyces sp. BH106 TaxID=3410409 RepID=UPI003CF412ED
MSTPTAASQPRRSKRRSRKLWPVGLVLALVFVASVTVAGGVFTALVDVLDVRHLKTETRLTSKTLFDMVKLSFGVVAGAGALVALVVAYRKQRVDEESALRDATRLHTERFTSAFTHLGDPSPAVRLGAVHALAGLADDAPTDELRQTCIDVLCAYLRMPYIPDPGLSDPEGHQDFVAHREVRNTIIRLIRDHLQLDLRQTRSWRGHDFDFTGAVLDAADFTGAQFTGGTVSFTAVIFAGATSFRNAIFDGSSVVFYGAQFEGDNTFFSYSKFLSGTVSFEQAVFEGEHTFFTGVRFSGTQVTFFAATFKSSNVFTETHFATSRVDFRRATFSGHSTFQRTEFLGGSVLFGECGFLGHTSFPGGKFVGSFVTFDDSNFAGHIDFPEAQFDGSVVSFDGARFSGNISFANAKFTNGTTSFRESQFQGEISFSQAEFIGGQVDFSTVRGDRPRDLLNDHRGPYPPGVVLPQDWQPTDRP